MAPQEMSRLQAAIILNLKPDALYTIEDLRAHYRAQALLFHPDKHPDDVEGMTAKFQLLSVAWKVLSHVGPEGFSLAVATEEERVRELEEQFKKKWEGKEGQEEVRLVDSGDLWVEKERVREVRQAKAEANKVKAKEWRAGKKEKKEAKLESRARKEKEAAEMKERKEKRKSG